MKGLQKTMLSQRSGTLLSASLIFAIGAGLLLLPTIATATSSSDDDPPAVVPSSTVENQFTDDPYAGYDKIQMIQTGLANLQAIRFQVDSFSGDKPTYTGVYADFCVYDATLNKGDDFSMYTTIEEMMLSSDHCGEHSYTLPLKEVVDAVTAYDSTVGQNNPSMSGLIFHTGYSGAGLVVNSLTTFASTLVVPEHPAIHDALNVCDNIQNRHPDAVCSAVLQKQLVNDVFTLATRSSDDTVTKAYVKFRPESTVYIKMVRELYPKTQWIFNYRNSEILLAKSTQPKLDTCVYSRRQPSDHLAKKADDYNIDLDGMTKEDLCALYLSTLFDAATQEHDSTNTGMLISYETLTQEDFLLEHVLTYFGLQAEIDADPTTASDKVESILSVKSHSRGSPRKWNVNEENVNVSEKVKASVQTFLKDVEATARARL